MSKSAPVSESIARVLSAAVAMLVCLSASLLRAQDEPLVELEFDVVGIRLDVDPPIVTVPKGIRAAVLPRINAGGSSELSAKLAQGAFIQAVLRGPSFDARILVGAPNEPLLLPPLNLVGDYSLDNIRLVDATTGETLLEGTPSSVSVRVFDEVLVARVESRPLTSDEIRERGIVIDENNYRAVEFTVGFVVDGQTVPVKFPVVAPAFYDNTEIIPDAELNERLAEAELINESLGATLPPELEATGLDIQIKGLNIQFVDPGAAKDLALSIPPIAGLVVIPGNIGFLNQFFSVQVYVENAAPVSSGLSVRDVTAEMILPVGDDLVPGASYENPGDDPLRFARVGTNAIIQSVLPIVGVGPDGKPGTEDDVGRLQPGAVGQNEFLVEGLREGLHVVDVKLAGTMDGLVNGPVKVTGRAAGSVLVRNPNFSLAFSHPRTIRAGEPYTASVTILNTSSSPANQARVSLPSAAISGADLTSPESVQLGDILPGETRTAEYRLVARRTGSITFSNISSDDDVVGRFRLRMGVDERGVALSPDSIGYPEFVQELPDDLFAAADRVLGQALSVATAAQLPPGVTKLRKSFITKKVLELAEAGQRLRYGDTLDRVLADLALDWLGARSSSPGFDQIIRTTDAGRQWRETLGNLMQLEQPGLSAGERLADRAADLAGRGEVWGAISSDDPAIAPGLGEAGEAGLDRSDLPQAAGYRATDGSTLFAKPRDGLPSFTWQAVGAGGTTTLTALLLDADGTGRLVTWSGVALAEGAAARFDPLGSDPTLLEIDADGDGVFESSANGAESPVDELAPMLIGVVQDTSVNVGRPRPSVRCTGGPYENYGTVVGVLFSKPMEDVGAAIPGAYVLDNGNRAGSVSIQPGGRVALLNLERGIGTIIPRSLTVTDVQDPRGNALDSETLAVTATASQGVAVSGRVVRADGTAAAGVPVTLSYYEEVGLFCDAVTIRPSQVYTGPDGRFSFDFIMSGLPYSLSATDTAGLSTEAIEIILQGSSEDRVTREKLLDLASQPSVRDTLLEAFAVGALPDAVALAEGLDRALLKDLVETGSDRIGTTLPVALRFRGRAQVLGRVFAADGVTGVPGAGVNLFPDPSSREKGRGLLSGNDGSFAFYGVPLGTFSLQVAAPDGSTRTVSETLATTGEERFIEVVLSAASVPLTSLAGKVFEADGLTPHGGARVYVGKYLNGKFTNVVAIADSAAGDVPETQQVETGNWIAANVPEGTWDLVAVSADGKRKGERRDIAASAGIITQVNLTLQARATVRGRVEFADGRPVENAIVAGGLALVRTAADGTFTLDGVPTGPRTISAGIERDPANGIPFPRVGSASLDVVAGSTANFVVVRFDPRGSITGRVLDTTGAPVPEVQVALPIDEASFAYARADENGVYLFENLALKNWTVSAPAPLTADTEEILEGAGDVIFGAAKGESGVSEEDVVAALVDVYGVFLGANDPLLTGEGANFNPLTWGYSDVALTFDGQVVNADIVFLPQGTVSGMVINGQGVPIGARVRLTGIGPQSNGDVGFIIRGERNSDPALGTFEFPGQLLAGPFGLQAASPFFPAVITHEGATSRVNPDATGIVLQFPPQKKTNGDIVGQVLNPDGSPAGAGVDVRISFGDLTIETDDDGRFFTQNELLPAVSGNRVGVGYAVEAEDPVTGYKGFAAVTVLPGIGNQVTVQLIAEGALEVLVTEADGTPVTGAAVHVMGATYPYDTSELVTDATGMDGVASLPAGRYSLRAESVQGATTIRGSAAVTVVAGETAQATIRLQPTGTIQGVFVEDDGTTPVTFAQILINGGLGFATTDGTGRFSVPGLPLGNYRLIGTDAVSGRIGSANASLSSDNQVLEVVLQVRSLGRVQGYVENSARDGFVAGAVVTLSPSDGLTPSRTVTSGPDGFYVFEGVVEGSFGLVARHPVSGVTGSASGSLAAGQELLERNILLSPRGEFTVTVFGPDGITPAEATVTRNGGTSADTDAEGKAFFGNLPLGSYTLTAQSRVPGSLRSAARRSVTISSPGANPEVSMTLAGVGMIRGTVFDADGSTPLGAATVTLRSSSPVLSDEVLNVVTPPDGSFQFDDVSVGDYRLTATSVALGASFNGSISANGEVDVVNLVLGPSGTVRGRLLRADGVTPVSGVVATLFFDPPSGLLGVATDVTGADGSFEMSGIPVGDFDFEALAIAVNGIARQAGALAGNGEDLDLGDVLLDEDDPVVSGVFPADTSSGVAIDTEVLVTFSEAIDPLSFDANGICLCDEFGTVPATLSVEDGGGGVQRIVRLSPDAPLESERVYHLVVLDGDRLSAGGGAVVARGPRDLVGRPLLVPFQSSFTTEDARPPELLSLTPEDGAMQVDTRSVVRLSFDEVMDPTGVSITLTGPSGPVAGTTILGVNSQVAVFTPSALLQPNSNYTVTASGFRDLAGNSANGQPYLASFATLDTLGPDIAELRIKGGAQPVANAAVELEVVLVTPEPDARVRMTADFVPIGETTTPGDLDLPFTLPSSGSVIIRAYAIDRYGNEGPVAQANIAVVSNQPPEITVTQVVPGGGAPIETGKPFQLRAEASDDAGVVSFRAAVTGGAEIPLQSNDDGSPIFLSGSVNAAAGPGSPVTVVAQATDSSGETTPELTFEFPVADATPPTVAFVSPDAGTEAAPGEVLSIGLELSDNFGVTEYDVDVTGAFTFNQTVPAGGGSLESVTFDLTIPSDVEPDGAGFTVQVTASDAAANSSDASRGFRVPDLIAPEQNFISPGNNETGVYVHDITSTAFRGTYAVARYTEAIADESLVAGSVVMRDGLGGEVPGEVTRRGFGTEPVSVAFWPSGPLRFGETYTVEFTSQLTDLAGNGAVPRTITFTTLTLDRVAPVADQPVVEGQTLRFRVEAERDPFGDVVQFSGPDGSVLASANRVGTVWETDLDIPLLESQGDPPYEFGSAILLRRSPSGGFPPYDFDTVALDIRSRDEDSDGDGIDNGTEVDNGLDPFTDDADEDPDGDNLTNAEEVALGTDPFDEDTDGDGINDDVDPDPLTPLGGFAPVAGVAKPGSALTFDGVDDFVEIGNPSQLRITGNLTVECLFRTSDPTIGNYQTLVSKWWSGGAANEAAYGLSWTDGGLQFAIADSSGSTLGAQSGQLWNDGEWHHAAGTWDGNELRLFVDGVLVGSNSSPGFGPIANINRSVRIGTDDRFAPGTGDRFFNGSIDEVRIWNLARDVTEIRQAAGRRLTGTESGLAGYWHFDEGSGGRTYDRTIVNNDGELGNGTAAHMPQWISDTRPFHCPPVFGTDEDSELVIVLPGTDADGASITATVTALPASGALYQTPDGSTRGAEILAGDLPAAVADAQNRVIYAPAPGFAGPDAFSYRVSDPGEESSVVMATVNVQPANQLPVATADTPDVFQDVSATIPVLGNDSDADGEVPEVVTFTQPANGTVELEPDGSMTYTPAPGFTGSDSFSYTLADARRWNRFADYDEGVTNYSFAGNPNLGPEGFPVWRMEYTEGDGLGGAAPWYAITGDKLVWDPNWFSNGSGLWAVGNDLSPPVFSSGSHDSGRGIAAVAWTSPFDGFAVDLVGQLQTRWISGSIGQDAELVIAQRDASTGATSLLFSATVSKPTADASDERVFSPVDLRGVAVDQGDMLVISQRPTPDRDGRLYFYQNELFVLPASATNTATVTLNVQANQRPVVTAIDPGGVLELDGVDGEARKDSPSQVLNIGGDSWSISAWVNPSVSPGETKTIAGRYECGWNCPGGSSADYQLAIDGTTGAALFRIRTDNGTTGSANGTTNINDGMWHHVVGVFDRATETIQIWVDGDLEGGETMAGADAVTDSGSPFVVGRRFIQTFTASQQFFDGSVDEVSVWSRALGLDDIPRVGAQGPMDGEAGLVGYWNFDTGTGVVPDLTGNGNDLALSGGSAVLPGGPFGDTLVVPEDTDLGIGLAGMDGDGDALTAVVTVLPAHGRLYQTSDGMTRGAPILHPAGTALEFDGNDDVVFLPAGLIDGATDLTIQWWAKPASGSFTFFSGARAGQFNGFIVPLRNGGTTMELWEKDSMVASWSIPNVVDERWHSFTLVRNQSAGTVELFVDTVSMGSASPPLTTIDIDSGGFVLGQEQDSLGGGFDPSDALDGPIDEIRIWNRSLGAPEISALREVVLVGNESGLLALYRCDEGAGSNLTDSGPGGFDATLGGGAASTEPAWTTSEALSGAVMRIPVTDPQARVIYAPYPNFNGLDSLNYVVNDGKVDSLPGVVSVLVSPVNDAPVAVDDFGDVTVTGVPIVTRNVLANDFDPEGDAFGVASFDATSTAGGTIAYRGDGTFDYTPFPGFAGDDTFTYTLMDGSLEGPAATVTITVAPLNTYVWNNPAGGNWGEATNWTPNGVPGTGDLAIIDLEGDYTVAVNVSVTVSVIEMGSATGTQTLLLSGQTLTVSNQATLGPSTLYRQTAGNLRGTGNVFFEGQGEWTAGYFRDSGRKVNRGTFRVAPAAQVEVINNCVFVNEGTLHYDGPGLFYAYDGAVLGNAAGALWDIRTAGNMLHYTGTRAVLTNEGEVRKSADGASPMSWGFDNAGGTVDVRAGVLEFDAGGSSTGGTMLVADAATLRFDGGTFTLDDASSVSGAGGLQMRGATVNFGASFGIAGPVLLSSGSWYVNRDIVVPGNYTQSGGNLRGSGEIALEGADNSFTAGYFRDAGRKVNRGTLRVAPVGQVELIDDCVFVNEGTLNYDGPGLFYAYDGAVLGNAAGALWDVRTAGNMAYYTGTRAVLTNEGEVRKSADGASPMSWRFDNAGGTVDVRAGVLEFDAGGSSTGGTMLVADAATLRFDGGTFTLDDASSVSGAGGLQIRGATVNYGASFGIAGPVLLSSGSWYVNSDIVVPGNYTQSGGSLRGTGEIALEGADNAWTAGYFRDAGRKVNRGTLTVAPAGQVDAINGCVFVNEGTLNYDGPGIFYAYDGAVLGNAAGALWDVRTAGSMAHYTGTRAVLTNEGEVRKSADGSSPLNWRFHNAGGTVDVQSGALELDAGGSSTGGTMQVADGATLRFDGGTFTLDDASSVSGAGSLQMRGATVNYDAGFGITGPVLLSSGSWYVNRDIVVAGNYTQSGGSLRGTGEVALEGANNGWTGGNFRDPARKVNRGTLTVAPSGQVEVVGGCVFVNEGTLHYDGTGTFYAYDGAVLGNAPGALWDIRTAGNLSHYTGTRAVLTNEGELRKSAGGSSPFNWSVTNDGIVTVQSGELNFNQAYTQNQPGAAIFLNGGNIRSGGTLTLGNGVLNGAGTIFGHLSNGGATIRPGGNLGTLTVSGNYTQGAGGTLEMEIAGDVASGNFDTFAIGGTATLGGTFRAITGGFAAAIGEKYELVTYASRVGSSTFDTLEGVTSQNGIDYAAMYEADRFSLTAAAATAPIAAAIQAIKPIVSPGETSFAEWHAAAFGPEHLEDATICGELADPDFDGICNLLEYAFGGEPLVPSPRSILPQAHVDEIEGKRYLCLSYYRRKSSDLAYVVEGSANLLDWKSAEVEEMFVEELMPPSPNFERVTTRRALALDEAPGGYLRVRVEVVPDEALVLRIALDPETGQLDLSWLSRETREYALETTVDAVGWSPLEGHQAIPGTGEVIHRMVPRGDDDESLRLFRLIEQP